MNRMLDKQLFISTPLCLLTCESVCVAFPAEDVWLTLCVNDVRLFITLHTCCQSHAQALPLTPPTFVLSCVWGNSLCRRAEAWHLHYHRRSFNQSHPWRLINTNTLSPTWTHPSSCPRSRDTMRHCNSIWQQEVWKDLQETEKGKDSSD